jgi:ubiquitin-protein ligase
MSEAQRPFGGTEGRGAGTPRVEPYPIRFYAEDPAGNAYRAEALSTTHVRDVLNDFTEERGWPTRGIDGRPQRVVAELVDREDPTRSERLRGDQTLHDAGVRDGDTMRVLPESVAAAVHPHERLRALVVDHREVQAMAADDPQRIEVRTNSSHAPTYYEFTLRYTGVTLGDHGPELTDEHRVEILLPADYPMVAPVVRWLTPIFHPNIVPNHVPDSSARGTVCLGVLAERYIPGLGLAYIVRMLIDIVCYRNYSLHGYNREAAEWVASPEGQAQILRIGGVPVVSDHGYHSDRAVERQRTRFTRVNRFAEDDTL